MADQLIECGEEEILLQVSIGITIIGSIREFANSRCERRRKKQRERERRVVKDLTSLPNGHSH
jgi:hypothetical protein